MAPNRTALSGSVEITFLLPILNGALLEARRVRGYRLQLDCLEVEDFTSEVLAEIAQTKRHMLPYGADLMLLRCSGRVRSRMVHPMFEALCA